MQVSTPALDISSASVIPATPPPMMQTVVSMTVLCSTVRVSMNLPTPHRLHAVECVRLLIQPGLASKPRTHAVTKHIIGADRVASTDHPNSGADIPA
jgi:hypothetical protein